MYLSNRFSTFKGHYSGSSGDPLRANWEHHHGDDGAAEETTTTCSHCCVAEVRSVESQVIATLDLWGHNTG